MGGVEEVAVDPRLGSAQKSLEKFSPGSGSLDNRCRGEGLINGKKGTFEPKGIIRPSAPRRRCESEAS